jgi:plasmid stabilization system protein ParE
MTKVELTPRAVDELRDAVRWYADHSQSAARRLTAAYRDARDSIARDPECGQEIEPGMRRVLLRGYPYALRYTIEDRRVLILAFKHHRRHPDYWRR